MAGHTSEKRWRTGMNPESQETGVSEKVQEVCVQMMDALTAAEAAYAEMLEIYQYAGASVQGIADLLFKEDYETRTQPGTDAEVSVDVAIGGVSNPVIVTAGTGYTDGSYQLQIVLASGAATTDAILDYTVSGGAVTAVSISDPGAGYTDGLAQDVTNFPLAGLVPQTSANAAELAKAQDAFDAITALHELYQAADNVLVAQEDRLAQLRRMT